MRFPFSKLFAKHRIQFWRSRLVALIWRSLPTILAIIIVFPIAYFGALKPIDFWAYNSFTTWRGDRPWDDRVVIIAIDDASINKIGRFPWTRDRYVQLLQKLNAAEAGVIGFDILWSESSPADQQLAEALMQYQRVVLPMAWDKSGYALLPTGLLSNAGVAIGHILKREDVDGIVRSIDLTIQDIPALSIAILQTYALTDSDISPLPNLHQPLPINWTRASKNIPQISFSDVLDGKIPNATFRNKIVLVGVTALGIDSLITPFDRNPPSSGVYLHAMILQNILQTNTLIVVKDQDVWSITLLISLCMSLLLSRRNLWLGNISAFVLSGLWLVIAFIAFSFNYWLVVVMPLLVFSLTGMAIALQERWQIQHSLRSAKENIIYASNHDLLTGLFNRPFIEQRLQDLITKCPQNLTAILWINIDRFKNINYIFGHSIGNLLLVEVAQTLQSCVSNSASIARFSDAKFVIILEDLINEQAAINIAELIQNMLQKPLLIQRNKIVIAVNIGIKFHQIKNINQQTRTEIISPETLLRDADTAMFYAQKLGNSHSKVFEPSIRENVLERLQLEQDLHQAFAISQDPYNNNREFLLYYQPIVSLHNMQIVGLEALIRWRHPQRGLISPTYFIPLAEETGLIIPIGDWIMHHACQQLKTWHQNFDSAKDITISINLSLKQLAQDDVVDKYLSILQQTKLQPKYLNLEITENSIIENPDFSMLVLKKMQKAGFKIYIDDFGTGYSSLAYLHKFSFDGLKIDRAFVNNINSDRNGKEVLREIIALARNVNARVVAQGIESLGQFNYLQDLLGKEGDGQGFFLFRPLDVNEIEALLKSI